MQKTIPSTFIKNQKVASLTGNFLIIFFQTGLFLGSAIRNMRPSAQLSGDKVGKVDSNSRGYGKVNKGFAHYFTFFFSFIPSFVSNLYSKNFKIIATRLLIEKYKLEALSAIRRHVKAAKVRTVYQLFRQVQYMVM